MSKIKFKHSCTFQDGLPLFKDAALFREECRKLEGKEGYLTVHRKGITRNKSVSQLKYYWGVVIPVLGDHFGYEKDEMHAALGREFLSVQIPGKPPYVLSTACDKWTTAEWEEHLEKVRRWALQKFDVRIPLPCEIDIDKLSEPVRR